MNSAKRYCRYCGRELTLRPWDEDYAYCDDACRIAQEDLDEQIVEAVEPKQPDLFSDRFYK